jgi:hypothetical protein
MIDFVIGVAVGTAFAPFWMYVWGKIKDFIQSTAKPPV